MDGHNLALLWLGGALGLYVLPALVALWRNHHQTMAIVVLNMLLGWTVIGWVAALVWAATRVDRSNASAAAPGTPPRTP